MILYNVFLFCCLYVCCLLETAADTQRVPLPRNFNDSVEYDEKIKEKPFGRRSMGTVVSMRAERRWWPWGTTTRPPMRHAGTTIGMTGRSRTNMPSPDVTSQIFNFNKTEPPVEYSSNEDPENTTGSVRDETEKVVTGLTEAAVNWENVVLNDNMGTKEKQTMNVMINQIYGEAEVLVHQVNIIIDMHKVALGFEVGRVIGLIQARYRHMMELWREVSNKEVHFGYNPKTKMWPAAWSISHLYDVKYGGQYPAMFRPRMNNYFITVYAMIFEIERDIEKLIDILLAIPRYEMHLPPITMKHSTERTTTPQEDYGNPADDQAASHPLKPSGARKRAYDAPKWVAGRASLRRGVNLDEERLKHRMREKFLLRTLGLNESGHTPKPRFIQGWPVEETWDKIPLY